MQQSPRQRADELRKAGNFENAATEYARIWPDGDPWTGWGYGLCLRKLRRGQEALGVAEEVSKLDPEFRLGRSLLAWCLFDVVIKPAGAVDGKVLVAAKRIFDLSDPAEAAAYEPTSPMVPTILRVAKWFSEDMKDVRVLEWLARLDPDRLSVEAYVHKDERGRDQELASNRERYYAMLTKALQRLGQWEECLDTSQKALVTCGSLHLGNDVWFARRAALAKLNLGRPEEALVELERLAAKKPAGFMDTNIAEAAWEAGDVARTRKHALAALEAPGDLGYKLDAVRLLAEVLWKQGLKEEASQHVTLCIAARQARGWRIPDELTALAETMGVGEPHEDVDALHKRLRRAWSEMNEQLSPRLTGIVSRLFPHGRAGFIRGADGQSYYFDARDWRDRKVQPIDGQSVTFKTKAGFDRKKNIPTTNAADIRPSAKASS